MRNSNSPCHQHFSLVLLKSLTYVKFRTINLNFEKFSHILALIYTYKILYFPEAFLQIQETKAEKSLKKDTKNMWHNFYVCFSLIQAFSDIKGEAV